MVFLFLCTFPIFKCNIFKESVGYVCEIMIITVTIFMSSPTTAPGHRTVNKVNKRLFKSKRALLSVSALLLVHILILATQVQIQKSLFM